MSRTRTAISTLAMFAAATVLVSSSARADVITNGNLETSVSSLPDLAGNSYYYLDVANNVVAVGTQAPLGAHDGDTGRNANEWIRTSLSRGFTYSATGGNGGGGGFVSVASGQNGKPRAVAFFAEDLKATTGGVDISIDIKLSETSQFMTVQLWGWNDAQNGPELSMGGETADVGTYFVTTLNDATLLLDTTADTATLNTWTTIAVGNVSIGAGHDHYAWRIGIVGARANGYAFDNVTAVATAATPGTLIYGK